MIRVNGTTATSITEETKYEEEIYNFNVVRVVGDLELSTELGAKSKVKINGEEIEVGKVTDKGIYQIDLSNLKVSSDGKTYSVGNSNDVAIGTEESQMAKNTVVLKVEGNLTINSGVTLTAVASSAGYGGPKGMIVYCTETLTNNGTISMTARGAYAKGQNVYLYKKYDGTYEFIPAMRRNL